MVCLVRFFNKAFSAVIIQQLTSLWVSASLAIASGLLTQCKDVAIPEEAKYQDLVPISQMCLMAL